jgi:hypothetical protein
LDDIARALTIGLRTPIFPLGHGYQTDLTLPLMGMGGGSGGQAIHWAFQFDSPERSIDGATLEAAVARYLSCAPTLRRSLRIATDRLRTSQIHSWYHERVVDLGIALEAALLADTQDELAYRLMLRGTSLIGGDDAIRKANAGLLRRVYRLRSRVVHGGKTPHGVPPEEAAIDEGTALAYDILSRLVEAQAFPDWDALIMNWDAQGTDPK